MKWAPWFMEMGPNSSKICWRRFCGWDTRRSTTQIIMWQLQKQDLRQTCKGLFYQNVCGNNSFQVQNLKQIHWKKFCKDDSSSTEKFTNPHLLTDLSGAQVDVWSGGGWSGSGLVWVVGLVEHTPQQRDGRHDGVEDGQDARTRLGQVLLVDTHL